MLNDLLNRCSFPEAGTAVTCAVSGGADSQALLVLAVEAGCDVTVMHVDHGLRPRSHEEVAVVRAAASRFGAKFEALQANIAPGPNLEARARRARFDVLPPNILTGHTADDQAETILLNLMRGAGLDGLCGMRNEQHPILGLRRSETRAVCEHLQLDVVNDPSNADPAFRRNRVRHELLPLLAEIAQRDVVAIMDKQAQSLREDAHFLQSLADDIDVLDARALRDAPVPLARRAIRNWLRSVGGVEQYPPTSDAVERVLAVANCEVVACEIPGGFRIARTDNRLRIEPIERNRPQHGDTSE